VPAARVSPSKCFYPVIYISRRIDITQRWGKYRGGVGEFVKMRMTVQYDTRRFDGRSILIEMGMCGK
jgi:N-methylhydantoinase B/oxoprolinase/acetone carboxylase alpha subunit